MKKKIKHHPKPKGFVMPKEVPLEEVFLGNIEVRDNSTAPKGANLNSKPCECGSDGTFLCYPKDGECECGMFKHHVHCVCGSISQVG